MPMKVASGILMAFVVLIECALAQTTTGDIIGTVRDATGAVLVGVKVTLTDSNTNARTHSTTDDAGNYIFTKLKPGQYSIAAENEGFQKHTVSDIELLVGQRIRIDIVLQVGALAEAVEVVGGAVLLEAESASLGQVVQEKRVKDLPLNGRNFMQLAHLSAGVVPLGIGNSPVTSWTGRGDQSASISGQRESSNSYLVDGIETRNSRFGSTGIRPSVDAIQEFRIQRNTFSAEFGHGTAVINTAIKSGSNEFHGAVFEFIRNDKLDARNFFDLGNRPPFKQNNFGLAVEGPILRNKLFFFGNYEGLRQRLSSEAKAFYPFLSQLQGDLSGLRDNQGNPVTVLDPLSGQAFSGNQVPASRFSAIAKNLIPFIPAPNLSGGDPRFNTVKTVSNQNDFDQFHIRVDQNLSDNDRAFYRVSFSDENIFRPEIAVLRGERFPQQDANVAVTETHTFSPSLVNEFRFGYNRSKTFRISEGSFGRNIAEEVGLRNTTTNPFSFGIPNVGIGGFSGFGSIPQSIGALEHVFQWTENLSWIKSKHNIKTGFDIRRDRYFQDTNFAGNPTLNFSGQFSCQPDARGAIPRGCAIADFLLGFPSSVSASVGDSRQNLRATFYGLYLQDDYKVTRRLAVNLGLRYEYESPPYEIDNKGKIFDFNTRQIKVAGKDTRRSLVFPDRNNFAPRIGLAWTPFSNKTVLRAGFGVYYDLVNWNEQQFHVIGPPFFQPVSLTSVGTRPTLILDQMLPPFQFSSDATVFTLDEHNRNPYIYQWSFGVQQEIRRHLLVELGYAGSVGHKLGQRTNPNAGLPDTPGGTVFGATVPLARRRIIPGFGDFLLAYNGGNSNYHAFTLRVDKRFAQGFSVLGSYTWSKAIDSGITDEFSTHPLFLQFDRGLSTYDARHRLVASYIWDLPVGKGQRLLSNLNGIANKLLSGWQINGITTFQSGQPRNVGFQGRGPIAGGFLHAFADRVGPGDCSSCRQNIRNTPNLGPYFRLEDFRIPPAFTFGNAGRSILTAPGINNWDLSVFKNTYLREQLNLQFRVEFFNAFNHAQFTSANTTVGSPTYGQVTGARAPRDIQLALKLIF